MMGLFTTEAGIMDYLMDTEKPFMLMATPIKEILIKEREMEKEPM